MRVTHPSWLIIYIYIHIYKMMVVGWMKFEERISGGTSNVENWTLRTVNLTSRWWFTNKNLWPNCLPAVSIQPWWQVTFTFRIGYSESLSGWKRVGEGARSNRMRSFREEKFSFFQIFRPDSKGKSILNIQSVSDETRSWIDGSRQISPSSSSFSFSFSFSSQKPFVRNGFEANRYAYSRKFLGCERGGERGGGREATRGEGKGMEEKRKGQVASIWRPEFPREKGNQKSKESLQIRGPNAPSRRYVNPQNRPIVHARTMLSLSRCD